MNALEAGLYDLAGLFMIPVMLLILAALIYALLTLGGFAMEAWQRRRGNHRSALAILHAATGAATDDLELWILKRL